MWRKDVIGNIPETEYSEKDEEPEDDDSHIQWENIIFLPFHPFIQFAVFCAVTIKTTLGPMQAVYPFVYCENTMDSIAILYLIKYLYVGVVDLIYAIDTFFHILHRQITDVAIRRQFLPKSGLLILIDIISLVPYYRLIASDDCLPIQIWPNILGLMEFITVYRIAQYFQLSTTQSWCKVLTGSSILCVVTISFITCCFILFTHPAKYVCVNCTYEVHDWRKEIAKQVIDKDSRYSTVIYAATYVMSSLFRSIFEEANSDTIADYVLACCLMLAGFLVSTFVVFPKMFGGALVRLRRDCELLPRIRRIIEETKRRNPNPQAHVDVRNFYNLMWKNRAGITSLPEVILELPRYLRIDINQDLLWPVFYHSPTFRRATVNFHRWIGRFAHLDFKLPNECFFAGPQDRTHFFYLKSGIVQFISEEDGTTPLLSVTSGTIFGDVNFMIPRDASKRQTVRCLTYCEVYFFTRSDILRALKIFPVDRRNILFRVKDRIKHARTLYACKLHVRGLDRAEDEGVAWVKRRWWKLKETISQWKNKTAKSDFTGNLPPEEAVYHCSKYIGRLVLCPDPELQKKSMFASFHFPWIVLPNSIFEVFWRRLVKVTVLLVLLLYPMNIPKLDKPTYFIYFQSWTDFIYIADIYVLLITSMEIHGKMLSSYSSIMFTRFKSFPFILNLIAALWIEDFMLLIGMPEYYSVCQFNRLIKIYILFYNKRGDKDIEKDPFLEVCYKNIMVQLSYVYVSGYFIYTIKHLLPDLTSSFFYGNLTFCEETPDDKFCDQNEDIEKIVFVWTFRYFDPYRTPETLTDVYVVIILYLCTFTIFAYCTSNVIGVIFLKFKEVTDYLFFLSNLKTHYAEYHLHPGLLARLHRYILCHWKFYKGLEAADPVFLKNEPYDIYWKTHGEIAMNIIKDSKIFEGVGPTLIKEIAYHSKFTILPQNATLLLLGVTVKKVTWLVKGLLKNEYFDKFGVLQQDTQGPGEMLAISSVIFERESLFTTTALTDCEENEEERDLRLSADRERHGLSLTSETFTQCNKRLASQRTGTSVACSQILYIDRQLFCQILKRFPMEWSYIVSCTEKFKEVFTDLVKVHLKRHLKYKQTQEQKEPETSKTECIGKNFHHHETKITSKISRLKWNNPESRFVKYWMPIRAFTVCITIIAVSLEGGGGAQVRYIFHTIGTFCKMFTIADMILHCFIGYYDDRGILIYSKKKCVLHYLTRGFLVDFISVLPWTTIIDLISGGHQHMGIFVDSIFQCGRIYLVFGYFNYLADSPMARVEVILIVKWQVFLILVAFGTNLYMMSKCVTFDWHDKDFDITKLDSCWLPDRVVFDNKPTPAQMDSLFAESISITQSAFTRSNLGVFRIDPADYVLRAYLLLLGILFWWIEYYSLTLLILTVRGTSLFQNSLTTLSRFLHAERLDGELIQRYLAHFRYWWRRTKTINLQNKMTRRVSIIFSQDLTYFFLKQTLTNLDTLLKGGESMQRHLACLGFQYYFLPGWTIMREMNLSKWVYVVHRGKVAITREGKTLAYLTKGSIFGQLDPNENRPVHVTATSVDHVDIVQIPCNLFQYHINDAVRKNIEKNPESALDYMQLKKPIKENPYNTIRYLLREDKAIQLPWMNTPVEAESHAWYNRWLALVWMVGPLLSSGIVMLLVALPEDLVYPIMWVLMLLDLLLVAHLVVEFYTVRLKVIDNRCVYRHVKFQKFKEWQTYVDILSLLIPFVSLIPGQPWAYQLGRLLRIRMFYDFHKHFCQIFKSNLIPFLMKFAIVCLILHALACGWIAVACRNKVDELYHHELPPPLNKSFVLDDWVNLHDREEGCAKMVTLKYADGGLSDHYMVPLNWQHDYLIAMTFVLVHLTETATTNIPILSLKQLYYKIFVTYITNVLKIWILSIAITALYLEFRQRFNYNYNVAKLLDYLKHIGLTKSLMECVKDYTTLLWQKQRGTWLPELAQQAPQCMREDLLGTLYSHHLDTLPLFRALPLYFRRQLVARLRRIVIFSGKTIVEEGDVAECIYFIHEGDVEKWYTDSSGEKKMMSMLSTNGFFGLLPGLFPGTPFQFTYVTRTVVDMVYLLFQDWQDLLEGYPNIKHDLYTAGKQLKADSGR